MFLEHPNYTMLTDLLNATDDSELESAHWHEAQEQMERRAFSRGIDHRVAVQIRTSRRIPFQREVVVSNQVIDQKIIERLMESDSAVSAIGLGGMTHEISAGVKRIVVQQGMVEDFSSTAKSSFDSHDLEVSRPSHLGDAPKLPRGSVSREELDAIFAEPDSVPSSSESPQVGKRNKGGKPSYMGATPKLPKSSFSRDELNEILDAPDVSILDEVESEKKVPQKTSPKFRTEGTVKDTDVDDKKRKKQKFVQKGRDFGHGGRNDRKRGRNGPTGFH